MATRSVRPLRPSAAPLARSRRRPAPRPPAESRRIPVPVRPPDGDIAGALRIASHRVIGRALEGSGAPFRRARLAARLAGAMACGRDPGPLRRDVESLGQSWAAMRAWVTILLEDNADNIVSTALNLLR